MLAAVSPITLLRGSKSGPFYKQPKGVQIWLPTAFKRTVSGLMYFREGGIWFTLLGSRLDLPKYDRLELTTLVDRASVMKNI